MTCNNYAIRSNDLSVPGGKKSKFNANLLAIDTLNLIQGEDRAATQTEKDIMAVFTGWGGVPEAFDPNHSENPQWSKEQGRIKSTLTEQEYLSASRSTQDSHYTPITVIRAIYDALDRFGVKGGRFIDPSLGTGNFIGCLPDSMRETVKFSGVELDPIPAAIAQTLYPASTIHQATGFNDVDIDQNHFDVAIGNPPFGQQSIYDDNYRDISNFSIHNYFFAKSLHIVREGGLVAMVVSSYLMDKAGTEERSYLSGLADLVGAIRLPNHTFKAGAGTEVTTDIIFLQKRKQGKEARDESWVYTGIINDDTDQELAINQYFINNPQMMLGEMVKHDSHLKHGGKACVAQNQQTFESDLAYAISMLPQNIYESDINSDKGEKAPIKVEFCGHARFNGFFLSEQGEIMQRKKDTVKGALTGIPVEGLSDKKSERITGLIEIRDTLRDLFVVEGIEHAADYQMDSLRLRLNTLYDAYVKKYGAINAMGNKQAFGEDPDYPLLLSLEKNYDKGVSHAIAKKSETKFIAPSWDKADIFTTRVLVPHKKVTNVSNGKEALMVSLNEYGFINFEYMSEISGISQTTLIDELGDLIFNDPVSGWKTADEYLSGEVKVKLEQAIESAESDPQYARNALALRKVQPEDIEAVDISVKLGAHWLPEEVVKQFILELVDIEATVKYETYTGQWHVHAPHSQSVKSIEEFGTPRAEAVWIIGRLLSGKKIEIKDTVEIDGVEKRVINREDTLAANEKANQIREAFADWIWDDDERRNSLA